MRFTPFYSVDLTLGVCALRKRATRMLHSIYETGKSTRLLSIGTLSTSAHSVAILLNL
jgi:hypothetical protein